MLGACCAGEARTQNHGMRLTETRGAASVLRLHRKLAVQNRTRHRRTVQLAALKDESRGAVAGLDNYLYRRGKEIIISII